MTDKQLLEQALEALEKWTWIDTPPQEVRESITAIKARLEQPEQALEAYKPPAKWTDAEIKDGYRGIRWVTADGVYGRPTEEDVARYLGYTTPPAAPVQVSPLEFVTMVMEKEHLVGKPLFWAEWPNKEKNT